MEVLTILTNNKVIMEIHHLSQVLVLQLYQLLVVVVLVATAAPGFQVIVVTQAYQALPQVLGIQILVATAATLV